MMNLLSPHFLFPFFVWCYSGLESVADKNRVMCNKLSFLYIIYFKKDKFF